MIINTASEGMSLARKLENDSAAVYESLAKQFVADAEVFQTFAKENKKNIVQIDRAYYGVITDALEGCYALNLEIDKYVISAIPASAGKADAVKQAIAMEELIIDFYTVAAEQSRALMADVPQTYLLVAKKRKLRIEKLQAI